MSGLWSDYVIKLCARCGVKGYHDKLAAICRDCQLRGLGR